jgi:hypothetical protein
MKQQSKQLVKLTTREDKVSKALLLLLFKADSEGKELCDVV